MLPGEAWFITRASESLGLSLDISAERLVNGAERTPEVNRSVVDCNYQCERGKRSKVRL